MDGRGGASGRGAFGGVGGVGGCGDDVKNLATSSAQSTDAGRFGVGFGRGGAVGVGDAGCANAKKGVAAKKTTASDETTRRRKTDANATESVGAFSVSAERFRERSEIVDRKDGGGPSARRFGVEKEEQT
ncbi:MAG: hypothetical protein IIW01_08260, partial [Thermoguttaceae bacterium]|nr:hypothetical protein [Thermoguttaceae bacterium]